MTLGLLLTAFTSILIVTWGLVTVNQIPKNNLKCASLPLPLERIFEPKTKSKIERDIAKIINNIAF